MGLYEMYDGMSNEELNAKYQEMVSLWKSGDSQAHRDLNMIYNTLQRRGISVPGQSYYDPNGQLPPW